MAPLGTISHFASARIGATHVNTYRGAADMANLHFWALLLAALVVIFAPPGAM